MSIHATRISTCRTELISHRARFLVVGREGLVDLQDLVFFRGLFSAVGGARQEGKSPFGHLPQYPTVAKAVSRAGVDQNSVDLVWFIQKAVQGCPGVTGGFLLLLPRSFTRGVPFTRLTPRY